MQLFTALLAAMSLSQFMKDFIVRILGIVLELIVFGIMIILLVLLKSHVNQDTIAPKELNIRVHQEHLVGDMDCMIVNVMDW